MCVFHSLPPPLIYIGGSQGSCITVLPLILPEPTFSTNEEAPHRSFRRWGPLGRRPTKGVGRPGPAANHLQILSRGWHVESLVFSTWYWFLISRFSYCMWAHRSLCLRLIGREGIASDCWCVIAHGLHLLLMCSCQVGPFGPWACLWVIRHLYLGSFLLVFYLFSPNSPAHILRPASMEFVK